MASASIVGSIRPFQLLLVDRDSRPLWLSRLGELLGDWVLLVALLAVVYGISMNVAVVGLFMLARVLPRAVVIIWCAELTVRITVNQMALLSAIRVPLVASLVFMTSRGDLWWAGVVVLALGAVSALSDAARATVLPCVVPRTRLAPVNALNVAVERVSFVAGPALGALLLARWQPDVAFIVAATLMAISTLLLILVGRSATVTPQLQAAQTALSTGPSNWAKLRERPVMLTLVGALFCGAIVAISLKIALIAVTLGQLGRSEATLGLLLAVVGFGTFTGPVSIPRLMGRAPIALFVTITVVCLAAGMAVISQLESLWLVLPILFLIGLTSITNDMIATTAARRFTREVELIGVARVMIVAVCIGQVLAAAAMTIVASQWSVSTAMLVMSLLSAGIMGIWFMLGYGRAKLASR
jgi:hypothetical protein